MLPMIEREVMLNSLDHITPFHTPLGAGTAVKAMAGAVLVTKRAGLVCATHACKTRDSILDVHTNHSIS